MRRELQVALDEARTLAPAELPRLLGDLREVEAVALARLSTPNVEARPDDLLDVPAAAMRMHVSQDYLYRNHKRLPFTKRMGRKLLFSSSGLDAFLKKSK
jgi:hypothetical protein